MYFDQLCGLALLAVGIWILVDTNIGQIMTFWEDAPNSSLLRISAILLIVVGAVLFLVSLFGIIGAFIENEVMLGIVSTRHFFHRRTRLTFYEFNYPVAVRAQKIWGTDPR